LIGHGAPGSQFIDDEAVRMTRLQLLVVCVLFSDSAFSSDTFDSVLSVDCLVRVQEEVRVPSPREGLIAKMHVRRGMAAESHRELFVLDHTDALLQRAVAQAEYERAIIQAANEGRVRAAEATRQLAEIERQLIEQLGADAAVLEKARVNTSAVRSDAELTAAQGDIENSRQLVHIRKAELDLAQRDVDDRSVLAPISGLVREVIHRQGEWVHRGDPVLTITRLDHLLIEAFVDAHTVPPHRLSGAVATARLEVADGEFIEFKNLNLSSSTPRLELDGKYLVWAEFENMQEPDQLDQLQWVVRPGMKGRLEVHYRPLNP
jgi:multidrug efflux pump subunit AcrA (membrane-fusion protein)